MAHSGTLGPLSNDPGFKPSSVPKLKTCSRGGGILLQSNEEKRSSIKSFSSEKGARARERESFVQAVELCKHEVKEVFTFRVLVLRERERKWFRVCILDIEENLVLEEFFLIDFCYGDGDGIEGCFTVCGSASSFSFVTLETNSDYKHNACVPRRKLAAAAVEF